MAHVVVTSLAVFDIDEILSYRWQHAGKPSRTPIVGISRRRSGALPSIPKSVRFGSAWATGSAS